MGGLHVSALAGSRTIFSRSMQRRTFATLSFRRPALP